MDKTIVNSRFYDEPKDIANCMNSTFPKVGNILSQKNKIRSCELKLPIPNVNSLFLKPT